MRHVVNDRRPG